MFDFSPLLWYNGGSEDVEKYKYYYPRKINVCPMEMK